MKRDLVSVRRLSAGAPDHLMWPCNCMHEQDRITALYSLDVADNFCSFLASDYLCKGQLVCLDS